MNASIKDQLAFIKANMKDTYAAIQARAAIKKGTYALVRRGLSGKPNGFYANERGHVVGFPLEKSTEITREAAYQLVVWGSPFYILWGDHVNEVQELAGESSSVAHASIGAAPDMNAPAPAAKP